MNSRCLFSEGKNRRKLVLIIFASLITCLACSPVLSSETNATRARNQHQRLHEHLAQTTTQRPPLRLRQPDRHQPLAMSSRLTPNTNATSRVSHGSRSIPNRSNSTYAMNATRQHQQHSRQAHRLQQDRQNHRLARAGLGNVTNVDRELTERPLGAEDQELFCLFSLYMDTFVSVDKQVDMNDRLLFFVPLVIIYWRHRHPHSPFPYIEIDTMLRDLGQEGRVHRLVLRDMVERLKSNECGVETASASTIDNDNISTTPSRDRSAINALHLLTSWLDQEDRQATEMAELTERQSGSRQIVNWFHDLFARHRHPIGFNTNPRRPVQDETINQTLPPNVAAILLASRLGGTSTSFGGRDRNANASCNNDAATPETTTEPFGWPHYENRTDDFHVNERSVESSTLTPVLMPTTTIDQLQQNVSICTTVVLTTTQPPG